MLLIYLMLLLISYQYLLLKIFYGIHLSLLLQMLYRKVPTVSKKTTANEPESSKKRKRLPVQQPSHVQQQKPKKRGRPRKEKVSPTYDVSEKNDLKVKHHGLL